MNKPIQFDKRYIQGLRLGRHIACAAILALIISWTYLIHSVPNNIINFVAAVMWGSLRHGVGISADSLQLAFAAAVIATPAYIIALWLLTGRRPLRDWLLIGTVFFMSYVTFSYIWQTVLVLIAVSNLQIG